MGLLTNPSQSEKYSNFILKSSGVLSVVCYLGGLAWFASLAFSGNNAATYFSENALLPGLVDTEFNLDKDATHYLQRLREELENHKSDIPTAWLQVQFRHLGLEAYTHNFTLRYPLGLRSSFKGNNVYAIMRAPRADGTEALVISVPFRPPTSVHEDTAPGIAIMLAVAKFFRRRTYWAKDIIFLITEHEQLGVRAWLDAYYSAETDNRVLDVGILGGRSGKIQAAITLELHGQFISRIDVKVEGQTGQLPNLDLFNLVVRLCQRESIPVTFKNRENHVRPYSFDGWQHQLQTMAAMLKTQATCVPSGSHGHFLRYNVEAITLEGHLRQKAHGATFLNVGRLLEGIFRSLNNLLESLHQSFFFYLLPATDRYVSIGLYMPPFGLILLPMVLSALCLRIKMVKVDAMLDEADGDVSSESGKTSFLSAALPGLVLSHSIGLALTFSPQLFDAAGLEVHLNSGESIMIGTMAVFLATLAIPLFTQWKCQSESGAASWEPVRCVALLEMSLLLATISLVNFSLAFLVTVVTVPVVSVTSPSSSRSLQFLKALLLLWVSPQGLALTAVLYDTWLIHSGSNVGTVLFHAFDASKRAVLFAVTDFHIYGNWLYPVACVFHYSTWIQFWQALHL